MWLARRLAEFSSLHPDTPLHAVVLDDEPDFARSGVDLAIVHVPAHRLQADDDILLQETVFPVCSPDLHPYASVNVCRSRLLQEMHEHSPEIDWRNWSTEFGLPGDFETKIVRYSSFSQVIGAAVGGAGIALGRAPLIGRAAQRAPRAAEARPRTRRVVALRAAPQPVDTAPAARSSDRVPAPRSEADAEAEAAPIAGPIVAPASNDSRVRARAARPASNAPASPACAAYGAAKNNATTHAIPPNHTSERSDAQFSRYISI